MRRWSALAAMFLAAVTGFGCRTASSDLTGPDIEKVAFDPSLEVNLAQSTKTSSGLYYRDITVGNGAQVAGGSLIGMYYTVWLSDGTKIDERLAPAAPFSFTVGSGATILGVDEGVRGMRVGGVRQLIIPPHLGYGPDPFGAIPGNSVLVFRAEITSVQ